MSCGTRNTHKQSFEVTAGGTGDRCCKARWIKINVFRIARGNYKCTGGRTVRDGDRPLVGDDRGHPLGRIAQRCGEGVVCDCTFDHCCGT